MTTPGEKAVLQPGKIKIVISPNPFSSRTQIRLDNISEFSSIHVSVYDIQGRLIAELKSKGLNTYTWDAGSFQSGIYLLKIRSGNHVATRQLSVIK
jgi:hypothetical protein